MTQEWWSVDKITLMDESVAHQKQQCRRPARDRGGAGEGRLAMDVEDARRTMLPTQG